MTPEQQQAIENAKRRLAIKNAQARLQEPASEPTSTVEASEPQPKGGAFSRVFEPAMTMVSSAIAEPVAGITGAATAMFAGNDAGVGVIEGVKDRLTYRPRTEAGQEGLESVGEFMAPVGEAFTSVEDTLGDFAFRVTGSPVVAATAKSLPTAALEAVGLAGLKSVRNGTRLIDANGRPTKALRLELDKHGLVYENLTPEAKAMIPERADANFLPSNAEVSVPAEKALVEQIKAGGRDDGLAGFTVRNNRLSGDPLGQEAMKQGFEPGFVQMVKTANPATRKGMKKQLDRMRMIKANDRNRLDFRLTDVTGESLTRRLTYIRDQASAARKELNQIAREKLKGQSIDPQPVVDKLSSSLEDLNIQIMVDEKGVFKPIYKGSQISKDRTSQRVINDVIDLLAEGERGVPPDALRFHNLKRQLDTMIDFRKNSAGGLTDAGERVARDMRTVLNQSLREINPDYARVNDVLSTSLGAFDDLRDAVGSKIDIFGQSAEKALGRNARKIMTNYQTAEMMNDSIMALDDVARQLGGKFDDDVRDLAMFARRIEDRFGTVAVNSLQGEMKTAMSNVVTQGPNQTAWAWAGKKAGETSDKLRGINDFGAFEAMDALITRPW